MNDSSNNYELDSDNFNLNEKYFFIIKKCYNKYSIYYYLAGVSIIFLVIKLSENKRFLKNKEMIFNLENDISRATVLVSNQNEEHLKLLKKVNLNKIKLDKYEHLIKSLSKIKNNH